MAEACELGEFEALHIGHRKDCKPTKTPRLRAKDHETNATLTLDFF